MAVVVTSVFLVQLLCAIVPCNPRFPKPDLSPDPDPHLDVLGQSDFYHRNLDNGLDPDGHEKLSESKSNSVSNAVEVTGAVGNHYKAIDFNYVNEEDKSLNPQEIEIQEPRGLDQSEEHLVPIVKTKSGEIEGYFQKVVGGREIVAFEGVPYALPPVGHLRFRSPVPIKPWLGSLRALKLPRPCLQYNLPKGYRVLGTEDCLYLNVYSPHIPRPDFQPKLPVIVFIHGGGFFFGGSNVYGPAYLLQKDVVLCIIQYRLGILGFMSSGDSASSGNWALKDQTLALKWVHDNIEFFGGDPSRVTIMGQSAGSALVHFHMLSRLSRPYFSKAISMSGVALNYWALHSPPEARNFTQRLAQIVGCPYEDSFKMVDCLRETNPVLLLAQTQLFLDDWPYPSNAWRPCIETIEGNPDPFLTESPLELYAKNDVAKVPWIVTTVSGEGYQFLLFPFVSFMMKTLRKNWIKLAPDLADVENVEGVDFARITRMLTKFYFRNVPPEKAPVHNFADIITDRMFVTGVYKSAQLHTQIAPTYSYIFDVNGQYNTIESFGYSRYQWGVAHAEDIFYVFNSSTFYHGFRREDPEFRVSQFMVNLITNFADKGEPLYTKETGENVQVWTPHNGPTDLQYLKIGMDGAKMIPDPFKKRIRFWDKLGIPDTPSESVILNLGSYHHENPYVNHIEYGQTGE